jgi:ABC-type transport system substrate-binding protein
VAVHGYRQLGAPALSARTARRTADAFRIVCRRVIRETPPRRNAAAFVVPVACVLLLATPAAAHAADPNKVLRVAFEIEETGFDPVKVTDEYSNRVIEQTNEPLLTYDYLARPAKLMPLTAESLPEVTDNGKTYVFHVRKGIVFHPDPAFQGKRRELSAEDYSYSIKRLMDPKNRSPWRFVVDGKIVGLDELSKRAEKSGRFDYDAKVPGLEVIDRYTLRVRLKETDYNFAYITAMPALSAMAREVIEAYPEDTNAHPIGTGPYILKTWVRKSKMVLEANPDYRERIWDFQGSDDPRDKAAVAAMKGKRIPQIGRIEISIISEEQSRWLAFQNGQIDFIDRFQSFSPIAIPDNKLAPDFVAKGIEWDRSVETEMTYYFFNMEDPVFGGVTKEKIALRRAIIMSYNTQEEIRVIRKTQAIALNMPVPPGVVGNDSHYRGIIKNDPALANKLLDFFGYKKGADGYRTLPDGSPLVVVLTSEPQAISREYDELWKKSLDAISVRFDTKKSAFSDNIKAAEACQVTMWGSAWHSDYPDGENFMQLFYGPNTHQSNHACYRSAAFDKLYVQMSKMPNSPERDRLFLMMSRQLEVDSVMKLGLARYRNVLVYPHVKGFRWHPIVTGIYELLDIDISARRQ